MIEAIIALFSAPFVQFLTGISLGACAVIGYYRK